MIDRASLLAAIETALIDRSIPTKQLRTVRNLRSVFPGYQGPLTNVALQGVLTAITEGDDLTQWLTPPPTPPPAKTGRSFVLNPEQREKVKFLLGAGVGVQPIARAFRVHRAVIYKIKNDG
jgi:hypothetical protein